jgi:deazaflavin-dependent oxidoreductase (nitroreductase family)
MRRLVQRVAASDRFAAVAPRLLLPLDRTVYRVTGGRLMPSQAVVPSIVLTTTGARSGQPRGVPLAAIPLDGDWFVVASNFGREHHPAWSANLIADPAATMTMHGRERQVTAELLDADQKAEVWPRLTEVWPPFDSYVERSGRDLRVFRLRATG